MRIQVGGRSANIVIFCLVPTPRQVFKDQWLRVVEAVHLLPYMVWYGSPNPATTSSKIQKLPPTNKLGPGSNLQSNRNGSAIIGNVMPGRIHILGK